MAFMVTFKTGDGKPGYHQVDELDGALRFVEHLRNHEGVERAEVFRLDPVPIEFKTYYRVEVQRPADHDGTPAGDGAPAESAVVRPDDAAASDDGLVGAGAGPADQHRSRRTRR